MGSPTVINADKDILLILMDLVLNTAPQATDLLVKNVSNVQKMKSLLHIVNASNAPILILDVNSVCLLLKVTKFMSNALNARKDMKLTVMD